MFYCKVCHLYLATRGVQEGNREQEAASKIELDQHCKSRSHQLNYFKREAESERRRRREEEAELEKMSNGSEMTVVEVKAEEEDDEDDDEMTTEEVKDTVLRTSFQCANSFQKRVFRCYYINWVFCSVLLRSSV